MFIKPDVTADQLTYIEDQLKSNPNVVEVDKLRYLDQQESYEEAKRNFAGDPSTLCLLDPATIPSQLKVVPATDDAELLRGLGDTWRLLPSVYSVAYAQGTFNVVSRSPGSPA